MNWFLYVLNWRAACQSQAAAVDSWWEGARRRRRALEGGQFLKCKKLQFSGNFEKPDFLSIFMYKKLPYVRLWRSPL
jgi:hypothetical protein